MAIKITVSDTVGIKVRGTINNEAAVPQPFDFGLTCKRLDADQIRAELASGEEASLADFLVKVAHGWSGVKGDDDKPLEFSEGSLRELCKIPGVAAVAFRTYLSEVGAKEKN
jgi:hypothetical protein